MAELNKKLYIKNKDGTIETIKLYTTIDEVKKEQAYRPIMVGSMQAYYPLGDITNKYATRKRVKIGDTIYAALSETSVKEIKLSELPQTYVVDTGKYSQYSAEKVFNITPQQLDSLVIDLDYNNPEVFLYLDPDKGYDYSNIDFCKTPTKNGAKIIYYGTAFPNINRDRFYINTLDLSSLNDISNNYYQFYYLFPHDKLIYNPRSDTKTRIGVVLDYNHPQDLKLPVNVMPANINNDITITGNNFNLQNLCNILSDIYGNISNFSYSDRLYGGSNFPRYECTTKDIYKGSYGIKMTRGLFTFGSEYSIKYDISIMGSHPSNFSNIPRGENIISNVISTTFNISNMEFPLFEKKLYNNSLTTSGNSSRALWNRMFKINITNASTDYQSIKLKVVFTDPYDNVNSIILDNPQNQFVYERYKLGGSAHGSVQGPFILRFHISIDKYDEYIFIPIHYSGSWDDRPIIDWYNDIIVINSDGAVQVLNNSISDLVGIEYIVFLGDNNPKPEMENKIFADAARDSFNIDIILNESNNITPNDLFLLHSYWNLLDTTVFKPDSRTIYPTIHLKKYNKLLELSSPVPSSLIYTFDDLPNDDTL